MSHLPQSPLKFPLIVKPIRSRVKYPHGGNFLFGGNVAQICFSAKKNKTKNNISPIKPKTRCFVYGMCSVWSVLSAVAVDGWRLILVSAARASMSQGLLGSQPITSLSGITGDTGGQWNPELVTLSPAFPIPNRTHLTWLKGKVWLIKLAEDQQTCSTFKRKF